MGGARHPLKRFVPFVGHEASDYFFGAGLAVFSAHASGGMVFALEAGGGAWLLLGALTKGPLGLLRVIGRRTHAVLDVLVAVGLGISPILVHHGLDWIAVGFAEAVVLVQLRLAAWTAYDPAAQPSGKAAAAAAGLGTAGRGRTPPPAPVDPRLLGAARLAGRGAGRARRGASTAGARVGPAVDGLAGRLGRAAGAARRVGGKARPGGGTAP